MGSNRHWKLLNLYTVHDTTAPRSALPGLAKVLDSTSRNESGYALKRSVIGSKNPPVKRACSRTMNHSETIEKYVSQKQNFVGAAMHFTNSDAAEISERLET